MPRGMNTPAPVKRLLDEFIASGEEGRQIRLKDVGIGKTSVQYLRESARKRNVHVVQDGEDIFLVNSSLHPVT